MKICAVCHASREDHARFCQSCGARLGSLAAREPAADRSVRVDQPLP